MHHKMKWQLKKLFLYTVLFLTFEKSKIYVSLKINLIFHVQAQATSIKIIKSLNVNKAKEIDGISANFVKMSSNVIDCHLANISNNDISSNKYSKHDKTATVRRIFKKRWQNKNKKLSPCMPFKYFFENMRTISTWESHKITKAHFFQSSFQLIAIPIVQIMY